MQGQIPTKELMRTYIDQARNGDGVAPSLAFMGFATWTRLAQDFRRGEATVIDGTKFTPDSYCKETVVSFVVFDEKTNLPRIQTFNGLIF
jgi:hypothetical protein